jgi:hypothetical protein
VRRKGADINHAATRLYNISTTKEYHSRGPDMVGIREDFLGECVCELRCVRGVSRDQGGRISGKGAGRTV